MEKYRVIIQKYRVAMQKELFFSNMEIVQKTHKNL